METELLIFLIDIICLALGIISLKFPFMALIGVVLGLVVLVTNISSVSGIYLSFTIVTLFANVILLALAVFRSGDFYE